MCMRPGHANHRGIGEIIEYRDPIISPVVAGHAVCHLNDQTARMFDQERKAKLNLPLDRTLLGLWSYIQIGIIEP